jgi:hypothetical protein
MVLHQFLGTLEIIQPVCIGGLLSQTQSPFSDALSDTPDLIQDEITELPKTLNCMALYASTYFLEIIICHLAHVHSIGAPTSLSLI